MLIYNLEGEEAEVTEEEEIEEEDIEEDTTLEEEGDIEETQTEVATEVNQAEEVIEVDIEVIQEVEDIMKNKITITLVQSIKSLIKISMKIFPSIHMAVIRKSLNQKR